MHNQNGSTLVVSLVLLTIITLVAVYSLEGSSIQTKMVANSLFSTQTYQECRNEQEASVRFYNEAGGTNRNELIQVIQLPPTIDGETGEVIPPHIVKDSITKQYTEFAPKSENIQMRWSYLGERQAYNHGYNIDTESQNRAHLFENDCIATLNFSQNNQTLGAIVSGLKQAGNIN
jgi:hypothetical protein